MNCLCLAHAAEPTEIADAQLPSGVNLDWEKASITAVNTKWVQINLNGVWRFAPASTVASWIKRCALADYGGIVAKTDGNSI